MKRIFFLTLLFVFHQFVFSQEPGNKGNLQELKKIPVPPSPNASAIGKFGDIPVGLSTGIPSIGIPFYTYSDKTKGLALDVSLSYHAGGHKVEDMAGNTGLGWSLNAGGVLSRTLRGLPDDEANGYLNTPALPYQNTAEYARRTMPPNSSTPISEGICMANSSDYYIARDVAENTIDGECDIFQFSVNGISGKFFFRKNGEIQLVSQSNIKVAFVPVTGISFTRIDYFIITDGQGIKYIFDQKELTDPTPSIVGPPPTPPSYISAWYISKIISADGQDEIVFTYAGADLMYEGALSGTYRSNTQITSVGEIYTGTDYTESFTYIYTYGTKRISTIAFPDGSEAQFDYTLSRLDYAGDKALTAVRIKSQGLEKKYVLAYDYFESPICYSGCTPPIAYSPNDGYKRLKLKSVTESDGVKNIPPYVFEYNPTALPNRNSKALDWWGYYNGNNSNGTLAWPVNSIPGSYPGPFIGVADRTPSEAHTKAWVLEKIFYPTGGNTRLIYELNDGFNALTYRSIGGLRVKRTEEFDAVNSTLLVTNYTYKKIDNTSSGVLQTLPNFTWYWTSRYLNKIDYEGDVAYYEHHMNERITPGQSLSYFNGSPVVYTRVRVDKTTNTINNGYSIHEFSAGATSAVQENNFPYIQKQDLGWSQGLLLKETTYDNANTLVKWVENEYDIINTTPLPGVENSRNLIAGLLHWDEFGTPGMNLYSARYYYMTYGRAELKKNTERIYEPGGAYAENITEYTYDNQYFVRTKSKSTNSKGYLNETRTYYPFNYTTTGLANRTALLNANRVAEPVSTETWEQRSGVYYLKNAMVSDYGVFNTSMIKENKVISLEKVAPINQSVVGLFDANSLKRHSSFKDQVVISAYDSKGRYTDMQTINQFRYGFIWGLTNNYPVASVKNAGSADIAYTSFELDGTGYWQNIVPGNIVASKGITGNRYYQQTGFSINRTGLNTARFYTVSYWSKNGAYTISGNQAGWPKTIRTATINSQTWTCYQHLVTGQSTISVTGTGAIDELRLYPQSAEMNTVTYNPLTGVSAQCDERNGITYYEYDGFFRLHLVRDQDGNILKKICYGYNNSIEDCAGISTTAIWQPTGQVRCKACPANAAYYTDRQEREEKDLNPSSATYNTFRWVDVGGTSMCTPPPDWQVQSYTCELNGGVNTGYQLVTEKDMNPCSNTYHQTRVVRIYNLSNCAPPGCVSCEGNNKKCINGVCETGIKVYTASVYNELTGLYDCTYHYEFSDSSWSANFIESSGGACPIF